jgi:hypothetical protein
MIVTEIYGGLPYHNFFLLNDGANQIGSFAKKRKKIELGRHLI